MINDVIKPGYDRALGRVAVRYLCLMQRQMSAKVG